MGDFITAICNWNPTPTLEASTKAMALTLTYQMFPPLSSLFIHRHSLYCTCSKSYLILQSKAPSFLSLCAAAPTNTSQSSSPIFLPFLQEAEEEEEEEVVVVEEVEVKAREKQELKGDPEDPIVKFFRSRTSPSNQDPQGEGKLSLQKNRRISWHLAANTESTEANEMNLDAKNVSLEEKQQLGSVILDRKDFPEGIVGEIVRKARNLPENLTLGEVLGDYEGRVDEKECVEVLALLGEEGLVVGCLYFFEWMRLQEPPLVTPRACTVLFPVLGRAGMGDKLMVLYMNLPSSKAFRDVHVYNAAISGLLCSKRYEDAWKIFQSMETDNIRPDHVTCSIMITIMRKTGQSAKGAWEFFERMNRKGVKWSSEVLGALVKSFCDERLINEALIIQSEMEKKGIHSNVIVYNTLMDAYAKCNQIEEAEGLYLEMKTKGIKPTAATFNILMDAYSRRMQPDIVEKLVIEMHDMGLQPNAKSYTCLISAYGRKRKMSDMAANAFLKMKKVGIKPTSYSYTALIHAYSVDGWHEKAYIAFENMQREGIKPSIETYTTLLDAFRRAGDTKTLMKIWKLMISDKIEGTRVTFNILLDGFAKQGHYIEARDVISEFGKIGLPPTVMTYNMLMNAYARGGQHSKLPQLLKDMATLNLKPDSITYSTMIYAYVRVRDFKRAFFYHKQMVKSGQMPDVNSYKKLRAILDVKAATKNRKDKSAILGIVNSTAGMAKARTKKKDEFWKFKKRHVKN
ncbi:putative Pentatricopeptide repeat-containing protein [Quillaja saponaria]|uniref:Pentatricopeptide repeat-containing protein n=1 Tax=Quillaja saponaria TaxID=32244 RepID=A0AAD7LDH2_QUISA|nr:putative Pentatricopeptide repeat-containing protein [Quillaja saponaria]